MRISVCEAGVLWVFRVGIWLVLLFPTVTLHGQGRLISVPTRRDMVFDHAGRYLYITTTDGFVRPYNLATGQLETGFNIGGSLNGVDIAPDDSCLLIAQSNTSGSQGTFHRLDLPTGTVTNINYVRAGGEAGAWKVAIGSQGIALVTTRYSGSGWVPLRQIDLSTNAIATRTDDPGSGPSGAVRQDTQVLRNADGSRMYLLESNYSLGPVFTYSAVNDSFGPAAYSEYNNDVVSAAVNRNGTLLGTRFNTATLDTAPDFRFVNVFNGLDSGVAFDATRDIFYGVNSATNQIIAYDTNTSAELFRIDIGEDMSPFPPQFGPGTLIASQDGNYLALVTASGIRIFEVSEGIPFPSPSPTFGTPQDMVFDHGGQHLYITTREGLLWPYNLATSSLETPYQFGGSLLGLDIASDDSFILVAQHATGITQGRFQRIDLKTGAVININYTKALNNAEGGAWDVAIASNGLALASTTYNGSGWTPLRQIDLTTNAITVRADAPGSDTHGNVNLATLRRSADRTRIHVFELGLSNHPVFAYDATTNTFGPAGHATNLGLLYPAANRNGSLVALTVYANGARVLNGFNYNLVHSFSGLDSGMAFDSIRDALYGVISSTDQIIAYDTNDFSELFRLSIGEDVGYAQGPFGRGLLVASQDGGFLALRTSTAVRIYPVTGIQLLSATSRMSHGSAGAFDLNLPLTGSPAVECRSGGAAGNFTMVFTFSDSLRVIGSRSAATANVTSGIGWVASSGIDPSNPRNYIVNLTGLANAQSITVTLSNVQGELSNSVSARMGILLGDTTGDGSVNGSDISQTEWQSGSPVTISNFRQDVNADGAINCADISAVKSKSGTGL